MPIVWRFCSLSRSKIFWSACCGKIVHVPHVCYGRLHFPIIIQNCHWVKRSVVFKLIISVIDIEMVSGVTPIGQSVTICDNCVTHSLCHIPNIQFRYIGKLSYLLYTLKLKIFNIFYIIINNEMIMRYKCQMILINIQMMMSARSHTIISCLSQCQSVLEIHNIFWIL